MTKGSIIALHGFLGQPEDFLALSIPLLAPQIFRTQICPLKHWAHRFTSRLDGRPILMGYSMGGRLALHCLLDAPERFQAAIILAAHPGISGAQERQQRYMADIGWATRCLREPWELTLQQWHQQPALQSSAIVDRREGAFCRESLSLALRYFSLGTQDFLTPKINELDLPILWLVPIEEVDKIEGLKLKHPGSQIIAMPKGGHRFMMANAHKTGHLMREFIKLNGISGFAGCFLGA